ncbi:MAG: DUF111 family protein [Candidatus Latescibacteria bacterium]|nr:DUF111 family protein [Candidatus Latescibacterota bacterium]
MKGPPLLLMAQVDDAAGETLGQVVQQLEAAGAANIQLVASLTKKGRPGHMLFIDLAADREDDIAVILAAELGIWGYRIVAATHKHFDIQPQVCALVVGARNGRGKKHTFQLSYKRILRQGRLLKIKAEHDQLVAIQAALRGEGIEAPLTLLKGAAEAALWEKGGGDISITL